MQTLLLTLVAADRTGIVKEVSDCIKQHKGNWLDSHLSCYGDRFAGTICVAIECSQREAIEVALLQLQENGILISIYDDVSLAPQSAANAKDQAISIQVEANDRPGIIEEIASALVSRQVNVIEIETLCESASMAGYTLFKAQVAAVLPEGLSATDAQEALEAVSDDVMVTVELA